MKATNIAARAGRWSATHRKRAIWGWLAFVLIAVYAGSAVGTKQLDNNSSGVGESGRGDRALSNAFPGSASETVMVQSRTATAGAGSFRAAVSDVEHRLSVLGFIRSVQSPYAPGNEGQISADGHSALVQFEIPDNARINPQDKIDAALGAVAAAQRAHQHLRIDELGDASAEKAVSDSISKDFSKAEVTSLPITLGILVAVFGALVAAGVPLLLALTAVAATLGLVGPISHISPVDQAIGSVVLLIGLAVGVDYSMFYLRREREERAAGREPMAAIEAAAATSGRAILVSGLTVMIAMAGMYLAGDPTFSSFASGTILVVAVAVVGSLTVLPAILAWLGDRVEKGRIPLLGRLKARKGGGFWSGLVDRVMRRPLIWGGAATAILVALAIPAFGIHTADSGVDAFPKDMPVIKTYDRMQAAFPGAQVPAEVVVSAKDVTAPGVKAGIRDLREAAKGDPHSFGRPVTLSVSPDRTVADLQIPLAGNGTDSRSNAALGKLREQLIPQTIGQVPGVTADVTGDTAGSKDFNDVLKQRMPLVFAFVLSAAFLLLLVTFRSIVIPLKAIVLNLLSVGAAYGVIVWIFQEGHLEGPLGFNSTGAITSWLPLFLFVVLFGLSMDYHVFILSRIREAYDRGMSTDEAVAHGIKTTAGVVTSAAAVMVAVFSIFATLSFLDFKEMGVGLAVAILIDATLVRAVLLPAAMKLLGERNWYLPSWLGWLPRRRSQIEPEPARA
jgi:uncharacterized membrane protein YdfJ with MMPL/SSD domain